jgi:hypothetical protein
VLYKFVSQPSACVNSARGFLKFTPIPELNDPSEMFASINSVEVKESLVRIRKTGYSDEDILALKKQEALMSKLAPEMMAIRVPTSRQEIDQLIKIGLYERIDLLARRLDETVKLMLQRTGILCLTRRYDSFPMWAHYANKAKGFVLEYSTLEECFPGDDTDVLDTLRNVTYGEIRPSVTFDPESHIPLFFSKLSDWSYEQEVRAVRSLSTCITQETNSGSIHLAEIDKNFLTRILVGWNVPRDVEQMLIRDISEINSAVVVTRVRLENGRVLA